MKSDSQKPESNDHLVPVSTRAPRRPYKKPLLRRLGSVRDLTLGSAGGFADGGVTFRSML